MRPDITKENHQAKINQENLAPYREEFQSKKYLSDESLVKILGRKPHLSSDYADLDSRDMAVEECHLWRKCEDYIYSILSKTS